MFRNLTEHLAKLYFSKAVNSRYEYRYRYLDFHTNTDLMYETYLFVSVPLSIYFFQTHLITYILNKSYAKT